MKKIISISIIALLVFSINSFAQLKLSNFEHPKKFNSEFLFGLRIPMAETRDDILSGFALRFGVGYQLTKNWEIFHLAFDFGNSSPRDPEWVTVVDPYSYYPTLEQEIVNVYGFPLTTRIRFQVKEQVDAYVGAGVAYYWFQTKLSDPYYGELKRPRKRHGPGGLIEAGIYTDAFSNNLLVGLVTNYMMLHTKGQTLTSIVAEEGEVVDDRETRYDSYFMIGISLKYYLGER